MDGLEVYKEPEPGHIYILSADVAEGLDDRGDPDFDSADVLDVHTMEQVAHLHGLWDTNTFGLMLVELGLWYNTALLAPERNNHGHAVINTIMLAEYPDMEGDGDTGLYYHTSYDKVTQMESRKAGFPTTPSTRTLMLDKGKSIVSNRLVKINSKDTLREMTSFVHKAGRKIEAETGTKDDRVISFLIALYLSQTIFFPQFDLQVSNKERDFTLPQVSKQNRVEKRPPGMPNLPGGPF